MKPETKQEISCVGDYIRVQANMIDDAFNALRDQVLKAENADSLTQGVEKDKVLSLVLLFDQGVMEAVNNILSAIKDVDDKPDQVTQLKPQVAQLKPVTDKDRSDVQFIDDLNDHLLDMGAIGDLLCTVTDEGASEVPQSALRRVGWMISCKSREMHDEAENWWDQRANKS